MLLMPRLGRIFSLLPCFSLTAGHHCPFSSPMPRLTRIFSLLPCFFFDGGAPQLFFFSCAPPSSDFLSSSLLFLCRRGTTGFLLLPVPRPGRIFSLLPCFFFDGGAPQLFFFSHAPPGSDFLSSSLFFLCRRGTTGFLLLPVPRPARIFSLLPCFFSAGGAPQASFCSPCPARLGFPLFFPAFSLTAGHHSSFSSPMPRPGRPATRPAAPFSQKQRRQSLSANFRFHVFHMPARSFRQNTVSKSSPSSIAS